MKKTIFFLPFLICINLQAYYVYIPCEGGVASATQTANSNIQNGFDMLSTQTGKVAEAYTRNTATLKKVNESLRINEELKMKYLLTLKEINLMQKEIIKIKATPDTH